MIKKALLVFLITSPFSWVYANGIDFRAGSDAADFTFLTESSSFGYGGADVGIGVFFDDSDNLIANSSILVSGSSLADIQALQFGIGVKAYLGTIDVINQTGAALAIGATGRFTFPGPTPLAVVAEAFVAPSVSSLGDFDGLSEFRIALEIEVTPSARAYVGYRDFDLEIGSGIEIRLDDAVHFGVRFSF